MKKKFLAVFFGTALVLSACGGGGDEGAEAPADNGGDGATAVNAEELFQQSCSACHGQDLKGKNGPDLSAIGGKYSKEEINNIILNGRGGMPPGVLKGEEASAVASWLAEKK